MGRPLELLPTNGGLSTVDLTAAATTQYKTTPIDVDHLSSLALTFVITETGAPTTGVAKLFAIQTDEAGNEIGPQVDLVTAIDTQTNGEKVSVGICAGKLAIALGGTIVGTSALVLAFTKCVFGVEVTTTNNGTTSTGDLTIHIQRRR